jgi:hypothetical protein
MFEHPEPQRRSAALAQLIATATLALCTLIAATTVSIGLAHADAARPAIVATSK